MEKSGVKSDAQPAGGGRESLSDSLPDSLFDEAVNHVIRLQANPGNPAAQEALAGWRARSALHERAWAEIAEIHGMTGTLLARPERSGVSRRKLLGYGAMAVGLGATGALFGPGVILAAQADHLTATAELRDITLPDGSRLTLGPASAIALDFAPSAPGGAGARRGITLLAGMVWCAIAPGATTFRLSCGEAGIESFAAELSLSKEAGEISLALESGAASLATGPDAGTALGPDDWLDLDQAGRVLRRIPLAASEASDWRRGVIVVDAEPLSVLAARIARWLPGRVVIADPGLGARLVSGVFDMSRPREALFAAVSPHGAGLRQISPWLTVITAL